MTRLFPELAVKRSRHLGDAVFRKTFLDLIDELVVKYAKKHSVRDHSALVRIVVPRQLKELYWPDCDGPCEAMNGRVLDRYRASYKPMNAHQLRIDTVDDGPTDRIVISRLHTVHRCLKCDGILDREVFEPSAPEVMVVTWECPHCHAVSPGVTIRDHEEKDFEVYIIK